jgi:hypothetical protein
MQVQAPKGQYRVIGLDPVDTLTWPSGPLWSAKTPSSGFSAKCNNVHFDFMVENNDSPTTGPGGMVVL